MILGLSRTAAIVLALLLGALVPAADAWSGALRWLVMIMLFPVFLEFTWSRAALQRSHGLLLLANILTAFAGWALGRLLGGPEVGLAGFFAGLSPTATAAAVVMSFLGGEIGYVITAFMITNLGIARTFQNLALFKGMSVLENIMTGRNLRMKSNIFLQALRIGPAEKEEIAHREYVERIIDFLEIQGHRKTPVGRLPYGLQKRVDLGRALALEPKLLLLDEPMAGMNVEEKQDMSRFILDVNREFGTTIVLIEHDMGVVMDISDRVVVLDYGKKIGDGTPDEVRNNEEVISAYLGTSH